MTVWISDRGIQSGKLKDILIHEAAHAYSYLVLRGCILQDGTTFRELAHQQMFLFIIMGESGLTITSSTIFQSKIANG